jgi:hypothetical protein
MGNGRLEGPRAGLLGQDTFDYGVIEGLERQSTLDRCDDIRRGVDLAKIHDMGQMCPQITGVGTGQANEILLGKVSQLQEALAEKVKPFALMTPS